MSFQERSAWACLVSIGVVFVPYFVLVFRFPMAALGLLWVAVAGMCTLLIGFHIVNAILSPGIRKSGSVPPMDELDEMIESRASKWAGITMAVALMTWVIVVMYALPLSGAHTMALLPKDTQRVPEFFAVPVLTAMFAVHLLFAGFVAANVVYYGGIIAGYLRLRSV